MKKFSILFLAAAVALVGAIVAPTKAEAIPAFARQVGVPCYSCHFQHIPKLNAFGRQFKLGGYTQSAQDLITDEGLSLPPAFGAAVVVKYRFIQKSPEAGGTKYGEWNLPDEAAILAGGRVGENMGALIEFPGAGGNINNKFIYSADFGGIRGGVSAYSTVDAGPGYSMELFNTGVQRNQFGQENADASVRGSVSGPWNNGAQGLGFFAGSELFFANVGLFGPAASAMGGGLNPDAGFNLNTYIRAAITPKIGDMDTMVGVVLTSGETKIANYPVAATATTAATTTEAKVKAEAMMIDAQLQTEISGMSLEVIFNYANVKNDAASAYNSTAGAKDLTGMDVAASLGLSKHAGVKASYGSFDQGSAVTAMMVGGWIAFAQNVDLSLEYSTWSKTSAVGYDSKIIALLEFAF